MPKVSVIMPVYNAEKYLRECCGSVLSQTLRDIEIICIDDGATDGSAAILAEVAARDSRVRVVSQPNAGQGAARNRGLESARGEYVYFMDADDELADPDAFQRLVVEMEGSKLDALFFDAETRLDEGVEVPAACVNAGDYIRRHDYSTVRDGVGLFSAFLANREYTVSPCLVMLRREFVEANALRFPEDRFFYEDNIFMTRVLLAAKRASHRPWRLYVRKVHAGSTVTSAPTMRHLRGYLACYFDACELLDCGGWSRRVRSVLADRRAIYKLHVRRIADASPALVAAARTEMATDEYARFVAVLHYPLGEKAVNAFRCLRDRGLVYTLRRIVFGRQPT